MYVSSLFTMLQSISGLYFLGTNTGRASLALADTMPSFSNLQLRFKTTQQSSVLAHLPGVTTSNGVGLPSQDADITVFIFNSRVLLTLGAAMQTTIFLTSTSTTEASYSDNRFHRLAVEHNGTQYVLSSIHTWGDESSRAMMFNQTMRFSEFSTFYK